MQRRRYFVLYIKEQKVRIVSCVKWMSHDSHRKEHRHFATFGFVHQTHFAIENHNFQTSTQFEQPLNNFSNFPHFPRPHKIFLIFLSTIRSKTFPKVTVAGKDLESARDWQKTQNVHCVRMRSVPRCFVIFPFGCKSPHVYNITKWKLSPNLIVVSKKRRYYYIFYIINIASERRISRDTLRENSKSDPECYKKTLPYKERIGYGDFEMWKCAQINSRVMFRGKNNNADP